MTERKLAADVILEVRKAVVGKDAVLSKALLAILARGHILLEDIPGVGKTTMALAFSGPFPSGITGSSLPRTSCPRT